MCSLLSSSHSPEVTIITDSEASKLGVIVLPNLNCGLFMGSTLQG